MPERRDVGGKRGDPCFVVRIQLRKPLPAMAIVFFLDPALVLQGLFPLAFERRGHQPIGGIDCLIAPLRQFHVVTGTLELLLPVLVQSLAFAPKIGARFQAQLQRRRLQSAEHLARYQLVEDIAGDAEARCLVERVVVDVEPASEVTAATIHWIGGFESRQEFARPVRTYDQLQDGDLLMKRIIELREVGKTAEQTADTLNAEGYAPINPGKKFNREIVRKLQLKLGIYGERDDDSLLGPGEWWVRDLASEIDVPWQTLREWAIKGWVHARQSSVEKLWILWADRAETKRLCKLRSVKWRGILGKPSQLTTPKSRPRTGAGKPSTTQLSSP